jgi:capsular exopolysaccharide synthesis family protein
MTNTLLATIVGAMWAIMVVFLKEYLDDTIRSSDEVEYLTSMPVLASIGKMDGAKKGEETAAPQKLITAKQSKSPIAEAYRVLRANIDFSIVDRSLQTLLVTSSGPKEGKSTTAANLAAAIAQTGRKVILVDTDLRRPTVHTFFGMSNERGVTMALVNSDTLIDTYIQTTDVHNLSVMASGPIPPNPAELLGSQRMTQVVDELKGLFDVVIFDSPPVLAVVDANLLARSCDATLMIVLAATTRASALVRAKEQLEQAGARLIGIVLNQVSKGRGGYYDYHYHYYYSSGSGGGKGGGGKGKGELVPVMYSRNGHGDAKSLERVE